MGKTANSSQEKLVYIPISQPELGMRIKECRKTKKMSQRQLGEQLKVSYQTIANWENGLRAPVPANLMRLAMVLGKPDNFFFCRASEQLSESTTSTLSENLRNYRKNLGLSQIKLSEMTGISLVQIKSYEDINSGQFITEKNLMELCKHLNAKPKELLGQSTTYEAMQEMTKAGYLRDIQDDIKKLNLLGLQKAAERIREMTELPRYKQ